MGTGRQHQPGKLAGRAAAVDREFPIDQHVFDPLGQLVWVGESRFVAHRIRVEDHDVSGKTFPEQTAVRNSENLSR